MRMHDFDIIVIGGGIGGLTLAIQSAMAGYTTAIFEKETYPFNKVCGEYISNESKSFLQSCNFNTDLLQLPQINRLGISDIKGRMYEFPLKPGGFGISRYYIDHALYQIALSQGVNVFTKTKVTGISFQNRLFSIKTKDDEFTCKVAVGAYGKRSNIDLTLKRNFILKKPSKHRHYIGLKYHVLFDMPHDTIELHNFSGGYCGISKIENNKSCLCYLTTADNLSHNKNSIKELEQKILFQNPNLKRIFEEATFLFDEPIAISQISFQKKTQKEKHLLMIGDAAGLISPLCGNGMSMAMHSGKIAFDLIDLFLKNKITRSQLENAYGERWQNTFARRLWVGRSVQKMFGNNILTTAFLTMMDKSPQLSKRLIRLTHGTTF